MWKPRAGQFAVEEIILIAAVVSPLKATAASIWQVGVSQPV
jgi:hypothetical protein